MGNIRFYDGGILFDGSGNIAFHDDCCCGVPDSPCECIGSGGVYIPTILHCTFSKTPDAAETTCGSCPYSGPSSWWETPINTTDTYELTYKGTCNLASTWEVYGAMPSAVTPSGGGTGRNYWFIWFQSCINDTDHGFYAGYCNLGGTGDCDVDWSSVLLAASWYDTLASAICIGILGSGFTRALTTVGVKYNSGFGTFTLTD